MTLQPQEHCNQYDPENEFVSIADLQRAMRGRNSLRLYAAGYCTCEIHRILIEEGLIHSRPAPAAPGMVLNIHNICKLCDATSEECNDSTAKECLALVSDYAATIRNEEREKMIILFNEIESGIKAYEKENEHQLVRDECRGVYIPTNTIRRLIAPRKESLRHTEAQR